MLTLPRPQTSTILRCAWPPLRFAIFGPRKRSYPPEGTVMAQTLQCPRGLAAAVAAVGKSSQRAFGLPFDLARETYAKAVRIGVMEDSILAEAKFARDLGRLEKLTLGPWARRV